MQMIVKCVTRNNYQVQECLFRDASTVYQLQKQKKRKQAADITCLAKYSDEIWSYGLKS